jgi:predicted small secreted protein
MKIDNRRAFLAAAAILCGAVLAGCNTVEGAGKDIENAGDAIKDSARDNKRK